MQVPDKIPVLIEHDRNQRCGVANSFSISNESGFVINGYLFDNDYGKAVASESDQGMPWQMSVHIEPEVIERIDQGDTT